MLLEICQNKYDMTMLGYLAILHEREGARVASVLTCDFFDGIQPAGGDFLDVVCICVSLFLSWL